MYTKNSVASNWVSIELSVKFNFSITSKSFFEIIRSSNAFEMNLFTNHNLDTIKLIGNYFRWLMNFGNVFSFEEMADVEHTKKKETR